MTTRSRRSLRFAIATLLLAGAGLVGTASAANGSTGCGEYSFGFEGTRLLNDGISDSAGPFPIFMPAGTYDITLHSFDDHEDHPGQDEQTQEQWYFKLDSGYTSPVSSDVPDDSNSSTDTFSGVVIEESTAISVHHLRQGGINSVAPTCVGFTTVVSSNQISEPETVIVAGPPPPAKEVNEVAEVPEVNEVPAAPAAPVAPAAPSTPDVPVEVKQVVEVPAPPVAVAAPSPAPAPQLAITGPSAQMSLMLVLGSAFLVLGGALLIEERRRAIRA